MNDERARGKLDQAKGGAKEGIGKLTGDRSTELSGKVDKLKGRAEEKLGDAKDTARRTDR